LLRGEHEAYGAAQWYAQSLGAAAPGKAIVGEGDPRL